MIAKFLVLWTLLSVLVFNLFYILDKKQRKPLWVLTRSVLVSLGISLPIIALLMLINNFSGI